MDWLVSALPHDIGDIYAAYYHVEYAASILRPFMREQCAWTVEKADDFQMLYCAQPVGAALQKREAHRDSRYFHDCAQFCERWDQSSVEQAYDTRPIEAFAQMVRARSLPARPMTLRWFRMGRACHWSMPTRVRLRHGGKRDLQGSIHVRDLSP